jgi:hypothetical protein
MENNNIKDYEWLMHENYDDIKFGDFQHLC